MNSLSTIFLDILAALLAVAILLLLLSSSLPRHLVSPHQRNKTKAASPTQTPSPTLIADEETEDDYARYLLECHLETQLEHLIDSIRDMAELPFESFVDHCSDGTAAGNHRNLQIVAGLKRVEVELGALQRNDACEVDDDMLISGDE